MSLSCVALAAAPPQPSPLEAAAQAKARGDAAFVAGRPADALREYEAARQLVDDPALAYNRGRALQALERFPEALKALEEFARTAPAALRARVPRLDALLLDVRTRASALDLTCAQPGAEVRVNDVVVGKTPLAARVALNAGNAVVHVSLPGHRPFERTVALPPAGVAVLDIELAPIASTEILRVTANVPGASVSIDQQPRGTAPFEDYLHLGTHRVEVAAEGFDAAANQVVLLSGEPRTLKVDLVAKTKLTERWYFWALVVGVVAAGAGAAAAASIERPPVEGTLGLETVGRP